MGVADIMRRSLCAVWVSAAVAAVGVSAPAVAQQQRLIVVGNDRGGPIGARADEISRIRAYGERVEIRGRICYSACTMYLGAGNVCVSPDTTFGFHGPSDWGREISSERFDHWSEVMSRHYNQPLRDWFMAEGRFRQSDIYQISGREIINLGYAQC